MKRPTQKAVAALTNHAQVRTSKTTTSTAKSLGPHFGGVQTLRRTKIPEAVSTSSAIGGTSRSDTTPTISRSRTLLPYPLASLCARDVRTLERLFVVSQEARRTLRVHVTTLASVTPWSALRALALKGVLVVTEAPRFAHFFGVPGWDCILTPRGRDALGAAKGRGLR